MGPIVFLLLLAAAGGLFLVRAFTLWQLVRLGRPVSRLDDLPKRVENETVVVLGQRKLLQRLGPGLMHAFIFWGFLILLTTTAEGVSGPPAAWTPVPRRASLAFEPMSEGWQDLFHGVFLWTPIVLMLAL